MYVDSVVYVDSLLGVACAAKCMVAAAAAWIGSSAVVLLREGLPSFVCTHTVGVLRTKAASQGLEAWPGISVRVFMHVQQARAGVVTLCGLPM